MAEAFPNSRFIGIDFHAHSIEHAKQHTKGLASVQFQTARAQDFQLSGFDLVTMFDALHGMGDPVGTTRHVAKSLKLDGVLMLVEPLAGESLADNLNPIGRIFSAASANTCVPAVLGQEVEPHWARKPSTQVSSEGWSPTTQHDCFGAQCAVVRRGIPTDPLTRTQSNLLLSRKCRRQFVEYLDWIAIVFFLIAWIGIEPMMAVGWPRRTNSLLLDMARVRKAWMREVLTRDNNFIGDAAILGHTINSASFFGSANLIVIVGMSSALFMEPNLGVDTGIIAKFTDAGPTWLFQCKVVLVMTTLLRGLSDFIWAVRQINYCLAAIGASPSREEQRDIEAWTEALTLVVNPALRSFSVGVRSYYFTVIAALWFLGPIAFIVATICGVGLLIWRQSWSDAAKGIMAIRKLLDENPSPPPIATISKTKEQAQPKIGKRK